MLIPILQGGVEDNPLLVGGEERVADPSWVSLAVLMIQVPRSKPRKDQALMELVVAPGARIYIHFRIDMFPCARRMCTAVVSHPGVIQIPGLWRNQTIVSWPAGARFPASGACAMQECRRIACRSNRSSTCAQASLKPLTSSQGAQWCKSCLSPRTNAPRKWLLSHCS